MANGVGKPESLPCVPWVFGCHILHLNLHFTQS